MKRCNDAIEELRLRYRREAQAEQKRLELYPRIKEAYDIVNKLRAIFKSSTLTKYTARTRFQNRYKEVNKCTMCEIKAARDAVKSREDEILNYFIDRSTNAGAESFNSKIKTFRALVRRASDLPFFMFRLCTIFG